MVKSEFGIMDQTCLVSTRQTGAGGVCCNALLGSVWAPKILITHSLNAKSCVRTVAVHVRHYMATIYQLNNYRHISYNTDRQFVARVDVVAFLDLEITAVNNSCLSHLHLVCALFTEGFLLHNITLVPVWSLHVLPCRSTDFLSPSNKSCMVG